MNIIFNGEESELITFTDTTIQKRLELQEHKNRLLTTMNASMHHEILTPLKVTIQIAERLKSLQDFTQLKEMAQIVSISSKLVLFHANDLLDHRIIQNGSFAPAYSHTSVQEALSEIVEMMRWTMQNLDLSIQFSFDSNDKRMFYLDKRRLQQVLLNLLSNAIKFQAAGKIIVRLEIKPANTSNDIFKINVSVIDQGIGMGPTEAANVFKEYWRSGN